MGGARQGRGMGTEEKNPILRPGWGFEPKPPILLAKIEVAKKGNPLVCFPEVRLPKEFRSHRFLIFFANSFFAISHACLGLAGKIFLPSLQSFLRRRDVTSTRRMRLTARDAGRGFVGIG